MPATLRDTLERIFAGHATERSTALKGNSFASFVRNDAAETVAAALSRSDLKIEGSVGQGNWAEIPWIGIFNPELTVSATRGIYVVYLFSADLEKLYLCQGQGVTQVKAEFGRAQIGELRRRVGLIQSRIPEFKRYFQPGPIALGGHTSLAKEYDDAIAYFKVYQRESLPNEDALVTDLTHMVELYDLLISRGATDNVETAIELGDDGEAGAFFDTIEERRRYVRHARIERNSAAARKAKKYHGTICQACGFDFTRFYGDRGRGYIEAHHLIPLHSLPEGKAVSMRPETDFAVLCANCHRMVHRGKLLLKLEDLKGLRGVKALRRAFEKRATK